MDVELKTAKGWASTQPRERIDLDDSPSDTRGSRYIPERDILKCCDVKRAAILR
jgi:hypothetical protein